MCARTESDAALTAVEITLQSISKTALIPHQNLIWSFHPRDFRVYRDIGLSDNYNPTIVLYDDCNSVLDKVAARILRCIITNALIMGRMKNRDFTG